MSTTPFDLVASASAEMIREGFHPDFPLGTEEQIAQIRASAGPSPGGDVKDLRGLLWSSIDNDTSRDLDQIEVAERVPDGGIRVMVAVADVDAFVAKDSAIDQHAERGGRTVYTWVTFFPMLPVELSPGP